MTDVQTPIDEYGDDADVVDAGRSHGARNAALVVGAVLVLLVVLLATSREPGTPPNPMIGRHVPELTGTGLDDEPIDIQPYLRQGKFVVVNFLASWCTPCVQEHPELVRFSEEHKVTGDAVVIGVVFNDEAKNIRELFRRLQGDWPVVVTTPNRPALDFAVTAVPESFVVAPNGRIIAHAEGVTYTWLNQVLDAAMGDGDAGDVAERRSGAERQSGPPSSLADGAHQPGSSVAPGGGS